MEQEALTDVDLTVSELITVEVAYATPEKQLIRCLQVNPGTKPRDVILRSGIQLDFPEIDCLNAKIGVFGKAVSDDYVLQDWDRIEIYRPLLADPKEVRRRLAAEGKTMGKRKSNQVPE